MISHSHSEARPRSAYKRGLLIALSITASIMVTEVTQIPGVQDFHDVHIWTITSGVYALSAHLLIEDQRVSECSQIIAEVNQLLGQRFGLGHTTLQLECESCESSPACDLRVLQKESLTVKS